MAPPRTHLPITRLPVTRLRVSRLEVARSLALASAGLASVACQAQQPAGTVAPLPDPHQPVAYVPVEGVTLSGPLVTSGGRATLGNNSTVAAGGKAAEVTLARGGSLKICASTSVHLSRDASPLGSSTATAGRDDAGLMLALDRGAIEADYATGRYSDVLLTPDLRILISGPGVAALRLRVNSKGDTCLDNQGAQAPYVTVSSLMDGGVYRVQANQRVLFEHGSLQQVVDREPELCGCPPAEPSAPSVAGRAIGGPSSTEADTAFPVAVSEGLAPPPTTAGTPIVNAGQAHAQVSATLSSDTPPGTAPGTPRGTPPGTAEAAAPASASIPGPAVSSSTIGRPPSGFFRAVRHFFARLVGK